MKNNVSALIAGLVFGLGLTISEMINPAKVLAFLDIFGDWDPSLALVMGGALAVTALGYRLAWRQSKPFFASRFNIPGNRKIDVRLAIGAILFGIGWGLVGLCPGPAISALMIGGAPAFVFIFAMITGMGVFELFERAEKLRRPKVPLA
ncbi:MAG: YeeE/YedE family protein [Marinicaulis sp.]|nr:YeeE/YedE family protein [Marinicaulis sp.]